MENRFGFKDFVLTVLLLAILASIWLAMVMFNRQHDTLRSLLTQMNQQIAAQARIERTIGEVAEAVARGVQVGGSTGAGPASGDATQRDPFARLRKVQQNEDYAAGDWLIDAFGARVDRITPLISTTYDSGVRFQPNVVEYLCGRDPETLEWLPLIASDWRVEDNTEAYNAYMEEAERTNRTPEQIAADPERPHALKIIFQIRRGATFSDGQPVTAEDVQFTYDQIMNLEIDAPRIRSVISQKIESVVATGPYEVVFTFREPHFEAFGLAASIEVLPKHFYSQFTPQEINQTPGLLLGSGPYRMQDPTGWAPGRPLVLVRNERYWGAAPAFDRLVFREFDNDVAQLTAFRNGEVDVYFDVRAEQYVQMLRDEKLLERTQHLEVMRPIQGYGYIGWNQSRNGKPTFFADKRVRQAMTMLTDRQRMVDQVLHGYGVVSTGPFNPLSDQSNEQIEPWPYDPERAKALLAEAGFIDRDGDGVIESSSGQPFVYRHTYPSAGDFWTKVLLLFKDNFARAGIVMELDPLEWSVFSDKLKSRDFDAVSLAWGAGIETDIFQFFHSSNMADGADNFVSYVNPQLDRLMETARSTVDESKRMPMWKEAHAILHEDQPYTFLYIRKFLLFVDDRVKNVQQIRVGVNDHTEWYVPQPLQQY